MDIEKFIGAISKFRPDLAAILIGIGFVMPVWFFDIFLFGRHFFNTNPIYLSIIASYCLSLFFLIVNIYWLMLDDWKPVNTDVSNLPVYKAVFLSLGLILSFTGFFYMFFPTASFRVFLIGIFGGILSNMIGDYFFRKMKKKQPSSSPQS